MQLKPRTVPSLLITRTNSKKTKQTTITTIANNAPAPQPRTPPLVAGDNSTVTTVNPQIDPEVYDTTQANVPSLDIVLNSSGSTPMSSMFGAERAARTVRECEGITACI